MAPEAGAARGADALVAQLATQRLRWVDVAPGKRVQIDTPSQFRAARIVDHMRAGDGDALVADLAPLFRAWDGVTQVDVLGAGVGGDGPAPADARLFVTLAGDRPDWAATLAMAAIELAEGAHLKAGAASGN